MVRDTLLLVGRRSPGLAAVCETHARRLERRGMVDRVETRLYDEEPDAALRGELPADGRVFAVPMTFAHTHETANAIPRALARADRPVTYCEPPGRQAVLTAAISDRAAAARTDADTLVLVGFGSGAGERQRRTLEYHADRLTDQYPDVSACYLLQNPAVECARYNVAGERPVAVPLFLASDERTREEIPEKLDLDRGGLAYAEPLGTHRAVTDALHAAVAASQVSGEETEDLVAAAQPVATDGRGG